MTGKIQKDENWKEYSNTASSPITTYNVEIAKLRRKIRYYKYRTIILFLNEMSISYVSHI